jgi:hypothetical protein
LYGCETRSATPSEEHRSKLLENRLLRRTFGPKLEERQEAGEDCIMRSFIICTIHQNIIRVIRARKMKWTRHAARMDEMRNAYNILVGKPEGKRQLGRPRRR